MNQVTSVFLRPSKCSLSRLHFFLIWIKLIICDHDSCAVFQFQHQDVLPIEHQLRFLALLATFITTAKLLPSTEYLLLHLLGRHPLTFCMQAAKSV